MPAAPSHSHRILQSLRLEVVEARRKRIGSVWLSAGRDHVDSYCRLYQVMEEGAWVEFRGERVDLVPGRLYLLPANQPFRYGSRRNVEQVYVHFHARVLGEFGLLDLFPWRLEAACPRGPALETVVADCESAGEWLEVDGVLRRLLALFLDVESGPGQESSLRALSRFQGVLEYIEANLERPLRVSELARVAHLQPNYFSNAFRDALGVPPVHYVNRRRVQRAELLLRNTSMTLAQIAGQTGFSDAFSLSKTFKKHRGMSPSAFRAIRHLP